MNNNILDHQNFVRNQIQKSFENEFEKANHNVGDLHPNGKWVWKEYKPGKFDWRVIPKKKSSDKIYPNEEAPRQTLNNIDAVYSVLKKNALGKLFLINGEVATKNSIQQKIDSSKRHLCAVLDIGTEKQGSLIANEMSNVYGNYGISQQNGKFEISTFKDSKKTKKFLDDFNAEVKNSSEKIW